MANKSIAFLIECKQTSSLTPCFGGSYQLQRLVVILRTRDSLLLMISFFSHVALKLGRTYAMLTKSACYLNVESYLFDPSKFLSDHEHLISANFDQRKDRKSGSNISQWIEFGTSRTTLLITNGKHLHTGTTEWNRYQHSVANICKS